MFNRSDEIPYEVPAADPAAPAGLVPLAELAAEGWGWDVPRIATPRAAVDALAHQLGAEVLTDDLGRRAVSRDVARRLFAERRAAEAKQYEAQQRRDAEAVELAANNPVRGGIPADRVPDGVSPAAAMLQAAQDDEPRRTSVLEEALSNRDDIVFRSFDRGDES